MLTALHTDRLEGNLFSHAKQLHNGHLEGWTSIFCSFAQVITKRMCTSSHSIIRKQTTCIFFCSSLVHVSVACDYFLLDESSNSWIKCTIWAYLSAYMRTQICRPSANTSVYANMHFHMGQEYDSSFKLISRLNLCGGWCAPSVHSS
jgi:hypothetical protein